MNINDVLKILTYAFFSLTGIGLITSIIIFFKLRIVEVIQDLNGTLTQKQVEEMRKRSSNEEYKNFGQDILESGLGETGKTGRGKLTKHGNTVLPSDRGNDSDFVLMKNIVYINTSESI